MAQKRVVLVWSLVLAACTATPPASPATEKALKDLADRFVSAWNDHKSAALGALWSPDGTLHTITGSAVAGRTAIESSYAEAFKRWDQQKYNTAPVQIGRGQTVVLQQFPPVASRLSLRVRSIDQPRSDQARIRGTWEAENALGPDGAMMRDAGAHHAGEFVATASSTTGGWLLTEMRFTMTSE